MDRKEKIEFWREVVSINETSLRNMVDMKADEIHITKQAKRLAYVKSALKKAIANKEPK